MQKPKVDVKDRSEMDATDKNRIRRTKKAKIRKNEALKKKIEQRVKKLAPGMGNKRAEQRSIEAIKQAVVNDGKIIKPTKVRLAKGLIIKMNSFFNFESLDEGRFHIGFRWIIAENPMGKGTVCQNCYESLK